jgi:hypothetical protein
MWRISIRRTTGTTTIWVALHSDIMEASSWGTIVRATYVVDPAANPGSSPQHSSSRWFGGSTDSQRASGPVPWTSLARVTT